MPSRGGCRCRGGAGTGSSALADLDAWAASERREARPQQTELVAFRVGQDVPLLLPRLADVGRASTELEKAFELGVLITVGGVDVDVQPRFAYLRLIAAAEDDRRLRTAEPFARPDLQRAVVLAIEHDEVQDV